MLLLVALEPLMHHFNKNIKRFWLVTSFAWILNALRTNPHSPPPPGRLKTSENILRYCSTVLKNSEFQNANRVCVVCKSGLERDEELGCDNWLSPQCRATANPGGLGARNKITSRGLRLRWIPVAGQSVRVIPPTLSKVGDVTLTNSAYWGFIFNLSTQWSKLYDI